jgi:superfamily II DNA or RNA helicase
MTPLRPYQSRDINILLAGVQRDQNPLYVLPTRGGKTRVATEVIRVLLAQGWNIGFFVHRRELLKQAARAFRAAGLPFGVIAPGLEPTSHPLHIASIDTVLKRLAAGDAAVAAWLLTLDMICVDEAHHAVSESWLRLLKRLARAVLMGLTATAYRTDGRGLRDAGFNVAVRGPTAPQLEAAGYIAPFEVYAPPTGIDFSMLKLRGADFAMDEMQALAERPEFLMAASRAYAKYAPGQPGIVFAAGKNHADLQADGCRRAGWSAKSVDGDDGETYRDGCFDELASGDLQLLISCDLVSEGVDMPEVSVAIMGRRTNSTQLFEQQGGRIRTAHKDKGVTYLVDLVGNTAQHGMVGSERPWTLEGGVKGQERMVEPTRRCIRCWRVHAWAPCCPGCGAVYPPVRGEPATVWHLPGAAGMRPEVIASRQLGGVARLAKSRADLEAIAAVHRVTDPSWVDRAVRFTGLKEAAE